MILGVHTMYVPLSLTLHRSLDCEEPRKAAEHFHTFDDVDIRRARQKAKHF